MTTVNKRDYYEVLGLSRSCGEGEIKTAYRKLAIRFHPDKNPGDAAAEEHFKEAAEAYEVLTNPEKRSIYDRYGHEGLNGQAGFGSAQDIFSAFGDIFGSDIFGSFFGGARQGTARRSRGRSIEIPVEIAFEEMAVGVKRSLTIPRREICETCNGTGSKGGRAPVSCKRCGGRGVVTASQGFFSVRQHCPACGGEGVQISDPCPDCRASGLVEQRRTLEIDIPAGIEDGMTLQVRGEGEADPRGGPRGDLHCVVRVGEHDLFIRSPRNASDLFIEVPIPVTTALLGGTIDVPTLDGAETLKIRAGTDPGETLKVRGAGLPVLQGSRRGHLYVRVAYDIPKKPSRKLKKALESVQEIERNETGPARRVFQDRLDAHRSRIEKKRRESE